MVGQRHQCSVSVVVPSPSDPVRAAVERDVATYLLSEACCRTPGRHVPCHGGWMACRLRQQRPCRIQIRILTTSPDHYVTALFHVCGVQDVLVILLSCVCFHKIPQLSNFQKLDVCERATRPLHHLPLHPTAAASNVNWAKQHFFRRARCLLYNFSISS